MIQNHEIVHSETPVIPSTRRIPTSHNRKRPANYIPRPPNVFLLYRSDFLKGGKIPQEEETKQQNLSRIVGECWRRLDPKERAYWHTLAKKAEIEHAQKYPNYVYKPVRRDFVLKRRQKKSKEEEQRRCEELRKTYIPETIDPPPVKIQPGARKRKSRTKKKSETIVVASTSSLYSDGQLSADTFSRNAFMEPLVALPNINEQSLEAFHKNTIVESSSPEVKFSNLGYCDQYPVHSDEYYNTLDVDQVAPPPQIPQTSSTPTTFAIELHERFQRDRAGGATTTTAMFNAQYVDPSFFNPQSQFFPSSQPAQSQFLTSSQSANFDCTSEPIFQDLLLPPASFAYSQQAQVNGNFGFINSNHSMNFPLMVQANSQLCDLDLVEPAFSFLPNSYEITVNLDSFDISLDDINFTTLCDNFAPEMPAPLFGEFPPLAYEWNDLESSIDPINNL